MIVPTVIFVPSVMCSEVVDAEIFAGATYGPKANAVSITPYGAIGPTETVMMLREALKTSRFVFCSWSVLSDMETTNRKIFIMDLALDYLVIEIKEHQRVRYAGRKDSVPRAMIQKLKELYEIQPAAKLSPDVKREHINVWSGWADKQNNTAATAPSDIIDLIPQKPVTPVTIIIKDSLKAKLARF